MNAEEEPIDNSDGDLSQADPLTDPLAIEENCDEVKKTDEVTVSGAQKAGYTFGSAAIKEIDNSGGKIILIDVNSLKKSFPNEASEDRNAIHENASENDTSQASSSRSELLDDSRKLSVTTPRTLASASSPIPDSNGTVSLTLDDNINEEVEGARSDGSDSGLGLELSSSLIPDESGLSKIGEFPYEIFQNKIFWLFSDSCRNPQEE